MQRSTWTKVGYIFAAVTYWVPALGFWIILAATYGDCGLVSPQTSPNINACQNEKVLVVWGTLAALIGIYALGIWLVRRSRKGVKGS